MHQFCFAIILSLAVCTGSQASDKPNFWPRDTLKRFPPTQVIYLRPISEPVENHVNALIPNFQSNDTSQAQEKISFSQLSPAQSTEKIKKKRSPNNYYWNRHIDDTKRARIIALLKRIGDNKTNTHISKTLGLYANAVSDFIDANHKIFYSTRAEVTLLSPEQAKLEVDDFFKDMKKFNEAPQGKAGIKRNADATDSSFSEIEEYSSSSEESLEIHENARIPKFQSNAPPLKNKTKKRETRKDNETPWDRINDDEKPWVIALLDPDRTYDEITKMLGARNHRYIETFRAKKHKHAYNQAQIRLSQMSREQRTEEVKKASEIFGFDLDFQLIMPVNHYWESLEKEDQARIIALLKHPKKLTKKLTNADCSGALELGGTAVKRFLADYSDIYKTAYDKVKLLSPQQTEEDLKSFFEKMKSHNEAYQGETDVKRVKKARKPKKPKNHYGQTHWRWNKRTADSTETSSSAIEENSRSAEAPARKKRKTAARDQMSDVRNQMSEIRNQMSDVRDQIEVGLRPPYF